MKIIVEVYLGQVVDLLCVAAVHDPDLTDRNLNKAEIKQICSGVIQDHGNSHDGWDDEVDEMEAAEITGWAYAQARRYTW